MDDDLIRALGRLEGKVDGLDRRLDDGITEIRESVSSHDQRIDKLERDHWHAKGFIAAVSAVVAAATTFIVKGIVRVS